MKKVISGISFIFIFSFIIHLMQMQVFAQDFFKSDIKTIEARKKSLYFDKGIFVKGGDDVNSKIKSVRHFYSKRNGFERIVLDLTTSEVPRIYSYVSKAESKIYIDLFSSTVAKDVSSKGSSKFVKNLLFYPINPDILTLEIEFNQDCKLDIFYLENPGRVVIDVKA